MERLQKFLSRAGVASRRHAETLIVDGRVKVNGKVATVLGTQVDPQKDLVLVDGKLVSVNPDRKYFLFYKPPGVVTTLSDPEGRPTVADYAQETGGRVFPVGRLDYDAEGALLLTDDGELANKLMHPSHQVPRVYLAKVKGEPDEASLQKLVDGVRLEDGMAKAVQARVFEKAERNTWVKIIVTEGRQHLVKRLCAAIGHPVVRLYRPAHAGLSVHGLKPGQLRALTNDEIRRVKAAGDGDVQPEPKLTLPARRHGHAAPGFEPEPEEEDTRPEGKRAQAPDDLPPTPRGGEGRGEGKSNGKFGARDALAGPTYAARDARGGGSGGKFGERERGGGEDRASKFGERGGDERRSRFGERAGDERGGKFGERGARSSGGSKFGERGGDDRGGKFGERGGRSSGGSKFGERGGGEERASKFGERGANDRGSRFGDRGGEDRGGKFGERGGDRGGKFGERGGGDRGGKFGERGGEDRGGKFGERGGDRGGKFGERGGEDRGGKFSERGGRFGERGGEQRGGRFGERGGDQRRAKFGEGGGRSSGGSKFGGRDERGGKFGERGGRSAGGSKFGERGGRDDRGGKFAERGSRDDRGGRKNSRDDRGGREAGQGPAQPASAPFPGEPGYGRKPSRGFSGDKGGFRRDDRSGPRFGGRGGKPGGFKKGGFKGGGRRGG